MNGGGIFIAFMAILSISAIVIGVFMVLRSINHFKDWQNGEENQIWLFLAYLIGAVLLIPIGLGLLGFVAEVEALAMFFYYISPFLFYLSLVPIGLTTIYYIRQYLEK